MRNQQAAFWKFFILCHIDVEELASLSPDAQFYPIVEEYLETVLLEMSLLGRGMLLDRRLQIAVVPFSADKDKTAVWAYFPVHRRRRIARDVDVQKETRVLLVFFLPDVESRPEEYMLEKLRHQLGHVLLYLQKPKAKNDCIAADKEWKKWVK